MLDIYLLISLAESLITCHLLGTYADNRAQHSAAGQQCVLGITVV